MKKDPETARGKLLNLYGIGPETTDVILLYALDKPIFVIDEYTKRFIKKHNLLATSSWSEAIGPQRKTTKSINSNNLTYNHLQQLFQQNIPPDLQIYQNYHALIIIDQRGRELSKMEII